MPNNNDTPPSKSTTPKPKSTKKKKKTGLRQQKQRSRQQEDEHTPMKKRTDTKQSPQASPDHKNPKDNSFIKKLEQINKDMAHEVEHFEQEFESKGKINGKRNNIDRTPKGDQPLEPITTPKTLQSSLTNFGFILKSKNKKDTQEDLQKAQEEFVKKKGEENFVAGIAINLLKVEVGTFAKIDAGTTDKIEVTPITIEDKNPNFIGQNLAKEGNINQNGNDSFYLNTDTQINNIEETEKIESPKNEDTKDASQGKEDQDYMEEKDEDIYPICDENSELIENKGIKPNDEEKSQDKPYTSDSFTPIYHNPSTPNVLKEDNIDTIASGETSKITSNEEANKQVPPKFIRYRFLTELDNLDLTNNNGTDEITTKEKFKQIFCNLVKFINTIDSDAKTISWKNQPTFSFLPVNT